MTDDTEIFLSPHGLAVQINAPIRLVRRLIDNGTIRPDGFGPNGPLLKASRIRELVEAIAAHERHPGRFQC